jgi:hypothetical protein
MEVQKLVGEREKEEKEKESNVIRQCIKYGSDWKVVWGGGIERDG